MEYSGREVTVWTWTWFLIQCLDGCFPRRPNDMLAAQIGATVELSGSGGAVVTVSIPRAISAGS